MKEKIAAVCQEIYGADGVTYSARANRTIATLEDLGYGQLPICITKTQYSLWIIGSKGQAPGFRVNVREVRLSAGAGFIVAIAGNIMTMPGLGKTPAAKP